MILEKAEEPKPILNILDFGRHDKPFRQVQIDTLKWFESVFQDNDVIVIEAPTATGKSLMVTTIASYLEAMGFYASIITPTKILQDQYLGDFTDIPVLKGMSEYTCSAMGVEGSCRDTKKMMGKCCPPEECNYLCARSIAQAAPKALFNFHSYYANKMYKNVLIADEAHNTINFLYEFYAMKLWKCEVDYDDDTELNAEGIKTILGKAIHELRIHMIDLEANGGSEKEIERIEDQIERYGYIRDTINRFDDNLLIEKDKDKYFGKKKDLRNTEQEYIYVKPLKVDKIGEDFLWPKMVNKVILLSATINQEDVKTLGLQGKRVAYMQCPSPIPIERRPFMICDVASMAYSNRTASFPKIVAAIKKIAAHHGQEKGIVHCTYDMANKLKEALKGDRRYWFHDKFNKKERYEEFRAAKGNPILIASGMEEGIDLAFDAGRFQIITQLMRPSLEDKVNAWMLKYNRRQYNWETIRKIVQQTGRISRDPTDFGVTYMLDSEFMPFYSQSSSLWPEWFVAAMKRLNLQV